MGLVPSQWRTLKMACRSLGFAPMSGSSGHRSLPNCSTELKYASLGGFQRSADTPAGLSLMGARLYNPLSGRFLFVDPVKGGTVNAYSYPVDPINEMDLDGAKTYAKYKRYLCSGWNAVVCRGLRKTFSYTTGHASAAVALRYGAHCGTRHGMYACWHSPGWLYSRSATTIGDVVFLGAYSWINSAHIRHEKEHRHQWRIFGTIFPVLYAREGSNPCHNYFEAKTGWEDGGYDC